MVRIDESDTQMNVMQLNDYRSEMSLFGGIRIAYLASQPYGLELRLE